MEYPPNAGLDKLASCQKNMVFENVEKKKNNEHVWLQLVKTVFFCSKKNGENI